MALGDGVRRNIRTVTSEERHRFVQALLTLQNGAAGLRDEDVDLERETLTAASRAQNAAAFLPWHRELCDRFERMLRRIDPELSLHYWDWSRDPSDLFTPTFMESGCSDAPFDGLVYGSTWQPEDAHIVGARTFAEMRELLARKHQAAYSVYVGGDPAHDHLALHDPLALLLHSNVDRLFAMWQAAPDESWRLDPGQVYGQDRALLASSLISAAPFGRTSRTEYARPQKTCVHASIAAPPCYDTLPIKVVVDQAANPQNTIDFTEVYRGQTFARAASFQLFGRGNVTFEVSGGPTGPYTVITPAGRIVAPHSASLYQEVRVWFGFSGTVPYGTARVGTVTIRCVETGQEFTFTLHANTVPVPAAALEPALRSEATQRMERTGVTWTWSWRPA